MVLALSAVLVAGVSCTTDETPVAPSAGMPSVGAPSPLLGSLLSSVSLLTCKSQGYESTTATVGPDGGTIEVGNHQLVIPRGALKSDVRITAEQLAGNVNSVRFSPEGLQFARSAELTLSYDNCLVVLPTKQIVYTSDLLKLLEVLKSKDDWRSKTVTAPLDHFSRYAVAY